MDHDAARPSARARRAAAVGALALATLAIVGALAGLWGDLVRALLVPVLLIVAVGAGWSAATRRGPLRLVAGAVAVVMVIAAALSVLTAEGHGLLMALVLVLVGASVALSRRALLPEVREQARLAAAETAVGPARRGVLLMNPKSGGGKAVRFDLEAEARRRGIEPVTLQPGDDLLALAREAIARGADVIGMAGGDGSQALVASVAMAADVALVCIPAGTRNHFALDLGLDRDDVVGALDAFGEAVERRIDLATVGGRVFVNNVSLGVYAKIVQSPEYRDAKRQTAARMLPELLGPDAEPFDLRFTAPDGVEHAGAQIILVSNNEYTFSATDGFGTRARLDAGGLGIAALEVRSPRDAAEAVTAMMANRPERFRGWSAWSAEAFVVDSGDGVEAGVDGEALTLTPPLEFRSLPGAIRVRIPTHAPRSSPAAVRAPSVWWSIAALTRVARGLPVYGDRR